MGRDHGAFATTPVGFRQPEEYPLCIYKYFLDKLIAGVEIVGVRQSEDCQKFGRTAEDGVSDSPTDTRQIQEYFYHFLFTMSIFDNGNDPY